MQVAGRRLSQQDAAHVAAPKSPAKPEFAGVKFMYFSHQTLQVPRVARQCMVALCEAAAHLGAESEIVSFTARISPLEPRYPPFEQLYELTAPLRNTAYHIYGADVDKGNIFSNVFRLLVYARRLAGFVLRREHRRHSLVVCSARNYSVLWLLTFARMLCPNMIVLADVHGMPSGKSARRLHRRVDGNVCISQALAQALRTACNLPARRVSVAHSGVKVERFERLQYSKAELRARLNLPADKALVCYAGKVYYRYQEVEYLVQAAGLLGPDTVMLVVGGRPDQVEQWKAECARKNVANVIFRSFVPPAEIPLYLRCADLLVMYYPPGPLNDFRSPGKLFEYLASGTPVVAAGTLSVREVVRDGVNGFLVEPYRPELLARAVHRALDTRHALDQISRQAVHTAAEYTWKERARRFMAYAMELKQNTETIHNHAVPPAV